MYSVLDSLDFVSSYDSEVGQAMKKELARQQRNIELIASENIVSPAVMAAMGSVLTNKYAEGYPAHRYYGGCEEVDVVEDIARERAKQLFGAKFANVQPHSGAQANIAAYFALIEVGDTVMGMNLAEGGHLTHGSPVNLSGKYYNFVPYGVNADGFLDYDGLERKAKECKPKLIVAGASAYARIIDFKRISDIAKEVGAYFMVDMAHIAGLVATGLHENPCMYADVVTSTTHKTLRGPRGGIILTNSEEIIQKINKTVFPGIQGGPLMHVIGAKAECFYEALKPEFKTYQKQVLKNIKAMSDEFIKLGMKVVSGGTDNHLILLNVYDSLGITGKEAEKLLDKCHITVNKNTIPGEKLSPMKASGIRIGSPAMTTRGFKEKEFVTIAKYIYEILTNKDDEKKLKEVAKEVVLLGRQFPINNI